MSCPSVPASQGTKKDVGGQTDRCVCNWPECARYVQQIQDAEGEHVWKGGNGGYYRWQRPNDSDTGGLFCNLILLQGMIKHLHGERGSFVLENYIKGKKELWIALHHFPMALLKGKATYKIKQFSLFISRATMQRIVLLDNGRNRLLEDCNKVKSLSSDLERNTKILNGRLKQEFLKQKENFDTDHFVQVPCSSCKEVEEEAKSLSSHRSISIAKRERPLVTPISSNRKKKKKKAPSVEPGNSVVDRLETAEEARTKIWNEDLLEDCYIPPGPSCHQQEPSHLLNAIVNNSVDSPPRTHSLTEMSSPSGIAPAEFFIKKIKTKISSITNAASDTNHFSDQIKKSLAGNDNFQIAVNTLRTYYTSFDAIKLENGKYFYVCKEVDEPSDECEAFRVSPNNFIEGMVCNVCKTKKKYSQTNQIKRKGRESKSTNRRINDLNPEELVALAEDQRRQLKNLKMKNSYLKAKLKKLQDKEKEVTFEEGSNVHQLMEKVLNHIGEKKEDAMKMIVKALLELHESKDLESSAEDRAEFSEWIVSEIVNTSKKMAGKKSQLRFKPSTISIAMNAFLQSRKSYEDLAEHSMLCLPSIRHLQSMLGAFKTKEAECPESYTAFYDGRVGAKKMKCSAGHLLVDEVKIKSDMIWNLANDEISGFCNVGTDPKKMKDQLKSLLSGENDDNDASMQHATYANQWRFRSLKNESHTAEFFFNNGELDGDESLRQLIHVVTMYENIGIQIHGVCCDAGGANEGLYSTLRKGKRIEDDHLILADEYVSFANPIFPERLIWLWHCSTHNCKNSRNNLWRSVETQNPATKKQRRSKKLMRFDDSPITFGWEQIEYLYDLITQDAQNNKKATRGHEQLTFQSVNLDGLTLMNASYAKAPFSKLTLSEITDHLAKRLSVEIEGDKTASLLSRFHGYAKKFREKIGERKDDYKNEIKLICLLEYSTVMCSIFNERFLNKDWRLNLDNINDEEKEVCESLKFLQDWMKEKTKFKEEQPNLKGNKSWEPHLLATKTFKNIRIGISGFFGYARQVLRLHGENAIYFVPGLQSSQSSLESYFSETRYQHHDTTSLYARHAAGDNVKKTIKSGSNIDVVVNCRKYRESVFKEWQASRKEDQTTSPAVCYLSAQNQLSGKTTFSNLVKEGLQKWVLHEGFASFLLSDSIFVGYAKQSITTPREAFFKSIVSGEVDDSRFNTLCHKLVQKCWRSLDDSLELTDYRRAYHSQILDTLATKELLGFTRDNEALHDSIGLAILYQHLSRLMLNYIPTILLQLKPDRIERTLQNSTEAWKEAQSFDVNRFFGWALFSMRKKTRKVKRKEQLNNTNGIDIAMLDETESDHVLELLKKMSTFEHEIVDDNDYLEKYYSPFDRIYNDGWLTLVSPKYADLGHQVLVAVVENMNLDTIKTLKDKCVEEGREKVATAVKKSLLPKFLDMSSDSNIDENLRKSLFLKLVRKTFNARVGAWIRYYKSLTLGRGTTGENTSTLREDRKHEGGKKAAEKRRNS